MDFREELFNGRTDGRKNYNSMCTHSRPKKIQKIISGSPLHKYFYNQESIALVLNLFMGLPCIITEGSWPEEICKLTIFGMYDGNQLSLATICSSHKF